MIPMPYKNRKERKISISISREFHKLIYDLQKPHESLEDTLRRLLKL